MNQPIEDRIKKLEEEQKQLKEEVRQLREQRTDEMKPINVNLASQDVINRLDGIQQYFSQELKTVSDTWLDTLQEHYTEHKDAISEVKTVQSGHAKFFEEHGRRLAQTATKEDISTIETHMATKDDINRIEARQDRQENLLQAILDRLPPKQ